MRLVTFWEIVFLTACPAGFGQTTSAAINERTAARFLEQATWGPSAASIAEMRQMGTANWLNNQFQLNISDLPDQPILDSTGRPNRDLRPVQAAFFYNAVNGSDQLRQRVAFALSQIWVVSATAGVADAYAYPPYWRIFRDNAFGNYRDIIKAVTLNPAMGRYLNMANNNKGNPARGTAANENYARELLQLFTLGLAQLNLDGSPILDANQNPISTYDQSAVTNLARALTGWTYPTAPGAMPKTNNPAYYAGQMFAVESQHDTTAKTIFGNITLPAGRTAAQDLEAVLDALMQQTTMAPFVCQQLIQHLVTSNPNRQFVERVSRVFLDNGQGVRGDLKAVVGAILTDPDARTGDSSSSMTNSNYGHMREPILFLTSLLRGLNATVTPATTVYANGASMGENLFNAPSVFSYFSPGYRTEKSLLGPEFQIYSTLTAAVRADVVNTAIYRTLDKETSVDLSPFTSRAGDLNTLLDYINGIFLHGSMSSDLRSAALDAAGAAATNQAKAQAALYIVLTSGEYQIIQ
jgi:uncharacterized protein (DUF1800 family)